MRRYARGQKHVRPNRASFADDGVAAHDGCSRVDRHMVLDRGVPLLSSELLAGGKRTRNQSHTLIHLHMAADDAGFTDNCPCAMVHEKVRADLRPWMQIHSAA